MAAKTSTTSLPDSTIHSSASMYLYVHSTDGSTMSIYFPDSVSTTDQPFHVHKASTVSGHITLVTIPYRH